LPSEKRAIYRLAIASACASVHNFLLFGGVLTAAEFSWLLSGFAAPIFGVFWIREDARRSGYWPAFHYGYWLYALGPLLATHYFVHTRGQAGIRPSLLFALLVWGPWAVSWLAWASFDYLPDYRA